MTRKRRYTSISNKKLNDKNNVPRAAIDGEVNTNATLKRMKTIGGTQVDEQDPNMSQSIKIRMNALFQKYISKQFN